MEVKYDRLNMISDDLLTYAVGLLAEATDEENKKKLRIGQILRLLAKAIEEDEVESLARQVEWWAPGNVARGSLNERMTI